MYILSHIMLLFFDLEALEKQSNNDPQKMIALLEYHANKNLPLKKSKYKPSKVSLFGHCFLVNFNGLLLDKNTDILFKIQYIKLAAKRDYTLYKLYLYKNLQLSFELQSSPCLCVRLSACVLAQKSPTSNGRASSPKGQRPYRVSPSSVRRSLMFW